MSAAKTLPRRIEFVLSMPLVATTDTEADGIGLKEMLAHAALHALAKKSADEIARHIVVTDDVWTTAPVAHAS